MKKGAHQLARVILAHAPSWKASLRYCPQRLAVESCRHTTPTNRSKNNLRCFSSSTPPPPTDDASATPVVAAEENAPKPESMDPDQKPETPEPAVAAAADENTKGGAATSAAATKSDSDSDDDFASEFMPETDPSLLHPELPPEDLFIDDPDYDNLPMEEKYARYRRAYYHGTTFFEAWSSVWASKQTPFDLGRPTPALAEALERKGMKFFNILVPGFGSGHDLITIAKFNPNSSVLGVEIAGTAMYKANDVLVKAFRQREVTESRVDLICGDFFDDTRWDIYYDYDPKNYTEEALKKQQEEEEEFQKKGWNHDDYSDPEDGDDDDDDKKAKGESVEAATADGTNAEDEGTKDETVKNDSAVKDGEINEDEDVAEDKDGETDESGNDSKTAVENASPSVHETQILKEVAKQEPEIGGETTNTPNSVPEIEDGITDMIDKMTNKDENANDNDPQKQEEITPIGFDLIYDYGFFSSLPKRIRLQYAERMCEMLTPDTGRLLTIMYPVDEMGCMGPLEGPPFHATVEDYKTLLEPLGVIMDGEPYESPDTVPSRVGQELVCWWRRSDPVKSKKDTKAKQRKRDNWGDSDSDNEEEDLLFPELPNKPEKPEKSVNPMDQPIW